MNEKEKIERNEQQEKLIERTERTMSSVAESTAIIKNMESENKNKRFEGVGQTKAIVELPVKTL